MSAFLLAVSIGPVQDFIAAARRTNDLYAGSHLVSQITQAAAEELKQRGASLIYPADVSDGAPNKLLARVESDDPNAVAAFAEDAARARLRKEWARALEQMTPAQRKQIHESRAEHQIGAFLEFFAAWWPWDGQDATYREARRQVERLLAGRKALREFGQPIKHSAPKSPLDPSRDSVVQDPSAEPMRQRPLRLRPGEALDAVSLLKRVRGAGMPAPSTADITAETYLAKRPDVRSSLGNAPFRAVFERYREELIDEGRLDQAAAEDIRKAIGRDEPSPYFAILQADGDRIGAHLSGMSRVAEHADFSRNLAAFASDAKRIVRGAAGYLVYSGGDDVLAFLPVHTCLACASRLARAFQQSTGRTLSVGIAVVHFREPLWASLRHARAAEEAAKNDGGDCLHFSVQTRGGQERSVTHRWSHGYSLDDWRRWIDAFRKGLSAGFPYELEVLARECKNTGIDAETVRKEAERVLKRKEESEGKPDVTEQVFQRVNDPDDLHKLAIQLIVFHWLKDYPMQWEENDNG